MFLKNSIIMEQLVPDDKVVDDDEVEGEEGVSADVDDLEAREGELG